MHYMILGAGLMLVGVFFGLLVGIPLGTMIDVDKKVDKKEQD